MKNKITVIEHVNYSGTEIIIQTRGYEITKKDVPGEIAQWAEERYSEDCYLKEDELPTIEWYKKEEYTEEKIKKMITERNSDIYICKEDFRNINYKYREELELEETDKYWILFNDNGTRFI